MSEHEAINGGNPFGKSLHDKWHVDKKRGRLGVVYVRDSRGWLVAEVPWGASSMEIAAKIAAAPELLEALEMVLATLPGEPFAGSDADIAVKAARAAIAKAKGQDA